MQYQGNSGGGKGSELTLQGFSIFDLCTPIKAPIKINGEEQHSHKSSTINIVLNGTAAEDCSCQRKRSIMKNIEKDKPGYNTAVNKALRSHFSDPNILKNLLE